MEYISLQQCAEKVLRLSQRMLQHAQAGEWTILGQVEQERGKVLEHLFRHPEISQSLQTISDILFDVMDVDRSCMQLTEQARQGMIDELNQRKNIQQAVRLYKQNTA